MTRKNFSAGEISLYGGGERSLGARANSRKRITGHIVSNIRIVYILEKELQVILLVISVLFIYTYMYIIKDNTLSSIVSVLGW